MEEDLIGAISCSHEFKRNEVLTFACPALCRLVVALCRLGQRPVLAVCRSFPHAGCGSNEPVPEAKCGGKAEVLSWPVNPRARNCDMLILKCSGESLRGTVTTSHKPLAPTVLQQNTSPSFETAHGRRPPGSKKSGNGKASG